MPARTFTVAAKTIKKEAVDIASFEFADPSGDPLPAFTPGAHIDVHIAGLVRQYSLCNGPHDTDTYKIAVKKEPASLGGSMAMHERIKEGDLITISEPRNNFPLNWSAKHHLLLAGGIGITPLMSMARHLQAAGASFDLKYFVRSPEHAAFRDFLLSPEFKSRLELHCGTQPEALKDYFRSLLRARPDGGHMYVCGPRPFMDLAKSIAADAWPSETIHCEYFSAGSEPETGRQRSFQVTLARTGGTYTVPAGKTIIEVLAEHGVMVDMSCRQGVCGTCLTGVVEGIPDHRDEVLTEDVKASGSIIALCVSRSKSDVLILDL